jgi:lipopolysaccharide/colanic/teichoic acid biosynthesis glycosyltransferase
MSSDVSAFNASHAQSCECFPLQNYVNNDTIKHCAGFELFFSRKIPAWKRSLDILGSIAGLIIFSPLFVLISLIIKIVSPGPTIFKQDRIGYGGKPFTFYKFRTMKINADPTKHQQYLANLISENSCEGGDMAKLDDEDPNIIPLGKILMNTCIDELPQLINVLLGNMSLVGPRPAIAYEVNQYLRWHCGRFDAMPGMTGLWQVSGKNRLSFREMVSLDIRYCRNMSFFEDVRILLMTPFAIFLNMIHRETTKNVFLEGEKKHA